MIRNLHEWRLNATNRASNPVGGYQRKERQDDPLDVRCSLLTLFPFPPNLFKLFFFYFRRFEFRISLYFRQRWDGYFAQGSPASSFRRACKAPPATMEHLDFADLPAIIVQLAVEEDWLVWE